MILLLFDANTPHPHIYNKNIKYEYVIYNLFIYEIATRNILPFTGFFLSIFVVVQLTIVQWMGIINVYKNIRYVYVYL